MAKAFRDTPWPVLLLVLSFLCPTELSVYVGSARLPPHRALLLVLLPFAILALFGRRGVKPRLFDVTMLLFAVWTLAAYIYHLGQADGLQTGGALALDSIGSFLVARAFVRDEPTFAGTAGVLFAAVAVAGFIALPEALSGKILIHDFLRQVTGYVHPTGVEKRLGMTRAFGTFDHPIHLGTFCASGLALCIYATRRQSRAMLRAVVMAGSALLGFSSAPMLSIAMQCGLIGVERVTRGVKARIMLGFGAVGLLFAMVSLVSSRSPFMLIATGLTIDSWTGYYRTVIWEYGLINIWANPWVGLGHEDWVRPYWMHASTVDAFWLVIAMRTGIPAFVLLALTVGLLARGAVLGVKRGHPGLARMSTGWLISLTALLLVACTVHLWNVPFAYFFFFFLGLGACLADPLRTQASAAKSAPRRLQAARVAWIAPDALAAGLPPGASMAAAAPTSPIAAPRWPVPVLTAPTKPGAPRPSLALLSAEVGAPTAPRPAAPRAQR